MSVRRESIWKKKSSFVDKSLPSATDPKAWKYMKERIVKREGGEGGYLGESICRVEPLGGRRKVF